jgi:hypothetical protein
MVENATPERDLLCVPGGGNGDVPHERGLVYPTVRRSICDGVGRVMRRGLLKLCVRATSMPRSFARRAAAAISVVSIGCVALKSGQVIAPAESDGAVADAQTVDDATHERIDDEAADADAADASTMDASSGRDTALDAATDSASDQDATADEATDATGDVPDAHDAAPSPLDVNPSHLRLWLAANVGITCVSQRVTSWADQSGNHDDATIMRNQLGPQCQIQQNPHLIHTIDVPYFSAPISTSNPNVIDETLDVNLSFLLRSSYTIFVAARRAADYALGNATKTEMLLGTSIADETAGCAGSTNGALGLGYVYNNPSAIEFVFDQGCNGVFASAPGVPPSMVNVDTGEFDEFRGHETWVNGAPAAANADVAPLSRASGGAIGRAYVVTNITGTDQRFRGDIAEVIVYDTAFADVDRLTIERYLRRWQ